MSTLDDFRKLDLRIGKILTAEKVNGSEKLLRLQIDLGIAKSPASQPAGQTVRETRQIISGIAPFYAPENLVGKEIVIIANLEPRIFTIKSETGSVSLESQGMLLAADDGQPVLLMPDRSVKPGAIIS